MDSGDLWLAGIFFIFAIIVQITGILIADWRNHKRTLQRLMIEHRNKINYLTSEVFFKKKLEYFQNITKLIEDYVQNYVQLLFLLNNPSKSIKDFNLPKIKELKDKILIKKKVGDTLKNMREDKFINLLPGGRSLYIGSGNLPNQISNFVLTHTRLFTLIAQYLKNNLKDKLKNEEITQLIYQNITTGNNLVEGLKKELLNNL